MQRDIADDSRGSGFALVSVERDSTNERGRERMMGRGGPREEMIKIQHEIRENARRNRSCLVDLQRWETEMRKKDASREKRRKKKKKVRRADVDEETRKRARSHQRLKTQYRYHPFEAGREPLQHE